MPRQERLGTYSVVELELDLHTLLRCGAVFAQGRQDRCSVAHPGNVGARARHVLNVGARWVVVVRLAQESQDVLLHAAARRADAVQGGIHGTHEYKPSGKQCIAAAAYLVQRVKARC